MKTLKRVWVLFVAAAVLAGCHEGSSDATVGAASPASTGGQTSNAATLSWEAPTTDTNGAPLNNLAGYRIYYGVSEAELRQTVQVNSVGMQTYVVDGLVDGHLVLRHPCLHQHRRRERTVGHRQSDDQLSQFLPESARDHFTGLVPGSFATLCG